MTVLEQFPQEWQRALVLVAHPDDPELGNPHTRSSSIGPAIPNSLLEADPFKRHLVWVA